MKCTKVFGSSITADFNCTVGQLFRISCVGFLGFVPCMTVLASSCGKFLSGRGGIISFIVNLRLLMKMRLDDSNCLTPWPKTYLSFAEFNSCLNHFKSRYKPWE